MPCYSPIVAWRSRDRGASGKALLTFKKEQGVGFKLNLPCGQCIGCRLEKSRQWAMRCVHEASLYEANSFITLTYNDENLPKDRNLNKEHWKLFMKKLRNRFPETKIRYYHCGEYGTWCRDCDKSEKSCRCDHFLPGPGRPHYHACIFNFDFADKVYFKTINGQRLYTSDVLANTWGFGFCTVGDVTFESAAYVPRYIMKKVTGDMADEHYRVADKDTGEVYDLEPEYTTMSRGGTGGLGGIGSEWYRRYKSDVFPSDEVIIRGKNMKPPKFYDEIYKVEDPQAYERMKDNRVKAALRDKENSTWQRLGVRETVKKAQVNMLKRD